jgi:hypothetical protein
MWQLLSFIASLIAGLGLGSMISVWLTQRWEKKKLIYQTKLDLYSKFIESYQELVANPKDEKLKQLVVANQKKLELIAPKSVIDLSEKFYKASPGEGIEIRNSLIGDMRRDLGDF